MHIPATLSCLLHIHLHYLDSHTLPGPDFLNVHKFFVIKEALSKKSSDLFLLWDGMPSIIHFTPLYVCPHLPLEWLPSSPRLHAGEVWDFLHFSPWSPPMWSAQWGTPKTRSTDNCWVSKPLANLPLDPPSDYQLVTAAIQCPGGPGLLDQA